MDKILIVDDTPAVLQALSLLLEIHGYEVITTTDPEKAIQYVDQLRVSLVIQDMNFTKDTTSGAEGKALFHDLRQINPNLPIILITAWTDLELAVELVKAGAADYISKPWDDTKLVNTVSNLVDLGKQKLQVSSVLAHEQAYADSKSKAQNLGLIYASPQMQQIVDMAIQVAKSDVNVLITGANGAGKEKIAELIHAQSKFSDQAFVKVNCGALPTDLIEAELFGAEAGAFTGATKRRIGRFEAANGGTLFLDEIGNLSYEGQTKLLRVIQTGEFERLGSVSTQKTNVRIISATNADLLSDIQLGKFREDLYYRLNVIELHLAPLCERTEDIMPLVNYFTQNREVSHSAEQALLAYHWPGNVRELQNVCKRAQVLTPTGVLCAKHFEFLSISRRTSKMNAEQTSKVEPDKPTLEQAMRRHNGVIARVAREFSMSRQALYRRLEKYNIEY